MRRIEARDYRTRQRVAVESENGRITDISPPTGQADRRADWIVPAFVDVQINGCLGMSFNSRELTIEQVERIVAECRKHGIGVLCPTLVTNSAEALLHGFATLREACESSAQLSRRMPKFHLEGPYLSGEDGPRGAHPKSHIRPPDWDEFCRFQEAAGGRIGMVTLAPEYDNALSFIERLCQAGIVVAIGHTASSPARIREAVAAGARISTHLGNGSHAQIPRHENYIWEQLGADTLWASLIADGHHLPMSMVKTIVRTKTPSRCVLTCDASSLAGLPPGRYEQWGSEFEVEASGRVGVPGTPFLAGSGVFTDACVAGVMRMAGISLADAIQMAVDNPRELMGLAPVALEIGSDAEFVLFDGDPLESFTLVEWVNSRD